MTRRTLPLIAATALLTSMALAASQPSPAEKPVAELRAAAVNGTEPGACWVRYKLSLPARSDDAPQGWVSRWSDELISGAAWLWNAWAELSCEHTDESSAYSAILPDCPVDLG